MTIDDPVLCLIRHLAREAALFPTSVQEYHQPETTEASTIEATKPAGNVEDWNLEDKHHKARGEFFVLIARISLKYGRNLSRSTKRTPRA